MQLKYLVALGSLAAGVYAIGWLKDTKVGAPLIFFAGLLVDYEEVKGAVGTLFK